MRTSPVAQLAAQWIASAVVAGLAAADPFAGVPQVRRSLLAGPALLSPELSPEPIDQSREALVGLARIAAAVDSRGAFAFPRKTSSGSDERRRAP